MNSVVDYNNLTFEQIQLIPNEKLRDYYRYLYLNRIIELSNVIPGNDIDLLFGKPIEEINIIVNGEVEKMTSDYLFPNSMIKMYNSTHSRISKKDFLCPFCSSIISAGSEAIIFYPFFYNVTDKCCMVLKRPIRIDNSCSFRLPTNFRDLGEMQRRMDYAYVSNDEEAYSWSCNMAGGFEFVPLLSKRNSPQILKNKQ